MSTKEIFVTFPEKKKWELSEVHAASHYWIEKDTSNTDTFTFKAFTFIKVFDLKTKQQKIAELI